MKTVMTTIAALALSATTAFSATLGAQIVSNGKTIGDVQTHTSPGVSCDVAVFSFMQGFMEGAPYAEIEYVGRRGVTKFWFVTNPETPNFQVLVGCQED